MSKDVDASDFYSNMRRKRKVLFLCFLLVSHSQPMGPNVLRCHPACDHYGSSQLSPVHAYNFLSRCKFSTLTTRQPMVEEFYLLTC